MTNRARSRSWKTDLKWFLLFVALAQVGLIVVGDLTWPRLYDPEYGLRLGLLRERMEETPNRPVALVVGSSRIGMGFLPEILPPIKTSADEEVLPFNFSHLAAGPVVNLVCLNRIVREEVKPRWVVLELNPTCMDHEGTSMAVSMSSAQDLPVLQRYFDPIKVNGVYLRRRLNPWHSWRLSILRKFAPHWATAAGPEDRITLGPLGGDDAWFLRKTIDDDTRARSWKASQATYYEALQHYHVDSMTDRALRESVELCRKNGIECVLLVTPESSKFRAWYSAEGLATFERYCAELRRDYGVPIVDARGWVADEHFTDGHHPLRAGAEEFTQRLAREVLQPLAEGRMTRQLIASRSAER